jgi:hypothetical protein
MRPPSAGEIVLFARVLMRLPKGQRGRAARRLLSEVEAGGQNKLVTGQAHPVFGDGSLAARCLLAGPSAEPFADDADFLLSLIVAARAVHCHTSAGCQDAQL